MRILQKKSAKCFLKKTVENLKKKIGWDIQRYFMYLAIFISMNRNINVSQKVMIQDCELKPRIWVTWEDGSLNQVKIQPNDQYTESACFL